MLYAEAKGIHSVLEPFIHLAAPTILHANNFHRQCNRECPCNHCSRRQCSEACVYHPTIVNQASSPPNFPETTRAEKQRDNPKSLAKQALDVQDDWNRSVNPGVPALPRSGLSLTESFGYSNDSDSNTLALIRKESHAFLALHPNRPC